MARARGAQPTETTLAARVRSFRPLRRRPKRPRSFNRRRQNVAGPTMPPGSGPMAGPSARRCAAPRPRRLPSRTVPNRCRCTPASAHSPARSSSAPGWTETSTRPALSENSVTNGSTSIGSATSTPKPVPQAGLDQGLRQPAVGQVVRAAEQPAPAGPDQQLGQPLLVIEVDRRRPAAEMIMDRRRPRPSRPARRGSRRAGRPRRRRLRKPIGVRRVTSSITPSTPTTGVGRIGHVAGLVVEADVAAGHRGAERPAAVDQAARSPR